MIESFACPQTERIFRGLPSAVLPSKLHRRARRILNMIAAASDIVTDIGSAPKLSLLRSNDVYTEWKVAINHQFYIKFSCEANSFGAYEIAYNVILVRNERNKSQTIFNRLHETITAATKTIVPSHSNAAEHLLTQFLSETDRQRLLGDLYDIRRDIAAQLGESEAEKWYRSQLRQEIIQALWSKLASTFQRAFARRMN